MGDGDRLGLFDAAGRRCPLPFRPAPTCAFGRTRRQLQPTNSQVNDRVNEAVCQQLEEGGVKLVALRCAGFDKARWVLGHGAAQVLPFPSLLAAGWLPAPTVSATPAPCPSQVDLEACARHGIRVARVPAYSPRSGATPPDQLGRAARRWMVGSGSLPSAAARSPPCPLFVPPHPTLQWPSTRWRWSSAWPATCARCGETDTHCVLGPQLGAGASAGL